MAPFALGVLGRLPDQWFLTNDLAFALLPPWAVERWAESEEWALTTTMYLNALPGFTALGLTLDWDMFPEGDPRDEDYQVRRAPLYRRVLRFEFGGVG